MPSRSHAARLGVSALVSFSLLVSPVTAARACTSVLLPAADGGYVYGRTLEFGLALNSQLLIVPRNLVMTGTGPDGKFGVGGMTWTTKYAVTGANAFGLPIMLDGLNEKGMSGGLFNFPGFAEFQTVLPGEAKRSIASFELLSYILTSFATVDEVRAALPHIYVSGASLAQFGGMVPPIHVSVHDANGKSLAVEYTDGGKLNMYDNPAHVFTNSPPFPFHLQNLAQYQYVTANVLPPPEGGQRPHERPELRRRHEWAAGRVPGERAFRARLFRSGKRAEARHQQRDRRPGLSCDERLRSAPGSIGVSATAGGECGGINGYETTEWTAVSDMKNLRYYIRTYDNSDVRMIDLGKADLNARQIKFISLDKPPTVTDLTP